LEMFPALHPFSILQLPQEARPHAFHRNEARRRIVLLVEPGSSGSRIQFRGAS
jgi:hypothetical protein